MKNSIKVFYVVFIGMLSVMGVLNMTEYFKSLSIYTPVFGIVGLFLSISLVIVQVNGRKKKSIVSILMYYLGVPLFILLGVATAVFGIYNPENFYLSRYGGSCTYFSTGLLMLSLMLHSETK